MNLNYETTYELMESDVMVLSIVSEYQNKAKQNIDLLFLMEMIIYETGQKKKRQLSMQGFAGYVTKFSFHYIPIDNEKLSMHFAGSASSQGLFLDSFQKIPFNFTKIESK